MAFGIDTNKLVDRAVEKLGPYIERALGQFAASSAELDASIDAMATEQAETNRKLAVLIALAKRRRVP